MMKSSKMAFTYLRLIFNVPQNNERQTFIPTVWNVGLWRANAEPQSNR